MVKEEEVGEVGGEMVSKHFESAAIIERERSARFDGAAAARIRTRI
jgi:hypothetical protein